MTIPMTISMELEEAKKELMVEFSQVDKDIFDTIKKNIYDNLDISITDTSNFIWDEFSDYSNIGGEFAWKYIADLVPEGECYLFFSQIKHKNAYLFKNSKDLCDVIGETYDCEVYVTDYNGTYILCYTHEMFLTGCGKAKQWIEDFKRIKGIKD